MIYQKTLIYLDSLEPVLASWVVFDENGKAAQAVTRGDLTQLWPEARNYDTTVIVPAQDVVLTQAVLPKLNRQRLLQALPYALEESLIDDVSELHFAVADYQADGSIPVAIVAKEKILAWLAALKTYDIQPAELISGVFALPYNEKTWDVGIQAESCAVRISAFGGFACDRENLATLLEMSLTATEPKPETIQIYNFSQTEIAPLNIISDSTVLNLVKLNEANFLQNVAEWVMTHPKINLLQGEFQAKRKTSETKKIWLYACYALLAWIGLGFCKNVISIFILHQQNSRLENSINLIYRKNFPAAASVVAPRERMQSKLNELTHSASSNLFLTLLAKAGNVLHKNNAVTLKTLDFRDNQLNLELSAATFDDVDALVKSLSQLGLSVKEQNAAVNGTQVKANLVIQEGSA